MSPRKLYRTAATAEAVTWALLILGMLAKYVLHAGDLPVRVGGGIHGFVFLAYAVTAVLVAKNQRMDRSPAAVAVISAIIPYATIPADLWLTTVFPRP